MLTSLGKKLWQLRQKAIANGMQLLSENEILNEGKTMNEVQEQLQTITDRINELEGKIKVLQEEIKQIQNKPQ